MKVVLLGLLALLPSAHAEVTQGGRGILFGDVHSFSIKASNEWVLDNQSGVGQGLHMVFYPIGGDWGTSKVMMYGQSIAMSKGLSIERKVEDTIEDFRQNGSPDYTLTRVKSVSTRAGRSAEIYFGSGDKWGNFEAVAYFQEHDSINFLVFNARSKELLEQNVGIFYEMVSSYVNLYRSPQSQGIQLESLKQDAIASLLQPGAKEYELSAINQSGNAMTDAMRYCLPLWKGKPLAAFTYFVRISNDGGIMDFNITPANGMTNCFGAAMFSVNYPTHTFEKFVLRIHMKITP